MSKLQRRVLQLIMTVLFFAALALTMYGFGQGSTFIGVWNACNAAGALFVLAFIDTIPQQGE